MHSRFTPEASATGSSYARAYSIHVEDVPHAKQVQITTIDADDVVSVAEVSVGRTREIAAALIEAAELIDNRPPQVGDLNPTASQLDSLPKGSVVQFDDSLAVGPRFALKASDVILDQWVTDSGADWGSGTLASRGNTKITFIPEEIA